MMICPTHNQAFVETLYIWHAAVEARQSMVAAEKDNYCLQQLHMQQAHL
jgi:hypothetical protein